MNKKVNVEKFLADYELAVQEKTDLEANKEIAINAVDAEVAQMFEGKDVSEKIKDIVILELKEEKEKLFDLADAEAKVANFEKYLEDIEVAEIVEEIPAIVTAPQLDEFGNIIG